MEDAELLGAVFRAYYDARRHKRNTNSQLTFEMDCEHQLLKLYEEVRTHTYVPSPAICFLVEHPVKREIFASEFRDRVIHHLMYNYLAPIFETRLIHDCYSCRKGKGTSFGIDRFEHHIKSCTDNYRKNAWILKLDIKGYFMSINRQRLYDSITKTLKEYWKLPQKGGEKNEEWMDKETIIYLLERIIFRDPAKNCEIRGDWEAWSDLPPSKSLLKSPPGVGLPIGDLTSQLFSNVYLNKLDVFVKQTLGCKHYGRYVDDFFIIHESKAFLKEQITRISEFLQQELDLTLHPKKIYLQDTRKGAPFLGGVVKPYRRYAAERSVKSFSRAVNRISKEIKDKVETIGCIDEYWLEQQRAILNSYLGYLSAFKSRKLIRKRIVDTPILLCFVLSSDCSKVSFRKKSKYIKERKKEKGITDTTDTTDTKKEKENKNKDSKTS